MPATHIEVVLSNEERDTLIQILDIATKAGGLQVAQHALKFVAKLQDKPAPAAPAVLPDPVREL
jgi:hypothetical protein